MANANKSARGVRSALSSASVYEQMFKTRHRRAGRPVREDGQDALFGAGGGDGVSPILRRVAERRAYAVVHEEQRARLREVFEGELKVLRRRGVEEVARDSGISLEA